MSRHLTASEAHRRQAILGHFARRTIRRLAKRLPFFALLRRVR